MKIGIIASDKTEWHVTELRRVLEKKSVECYVFPITRLLSKIGLKPKVSIKGYKIEDYDSLIVRRVPGGNPEQVFYRMDVLHFLEDLGVYVINPADAIERSVDKYYTSALLQEAGIRIPRTIVCEGFSSAMRGFKELGRDVVVKPLFGSLGTGMTRISDPDIAYRVFRTLERIQSVYYLQEFIPHHNEDVRLFVIGDQVISSMKRKADGWKTNISGGARPIPYIPGKELIETSIKAADTIGLDYTGVDLLPSKDGDMYLLEVNSTPGWEGLQTVTDSNIAKTLVEFILDRLKR